MAGNIIPAIATTNAVIAGLIVLEGLKILSGELETCRTVSSSVKCICLMEMDLVVFVFFSETSNKPSNNLFNPFSTSCASKGELKMKIDDVPN